MTPTIQFNKTGHDDFIDFLKAFCIISVILAHNLPDQNAVLFCLWGGMQVPLFLLIQTFHSLKNAQRTINVKKIFKRIIVPFVILQLCLFAYTLIKDAEVGVLKNITRFIGGGGFGPGSYYFWIYLQFAFLLPLLAPIFDKWSKRQLLFVFIGVGVLCEVLCSLVHLPANIYRLLSIRYLFLLYLGFLWVKDGIVMNVRTWVLSMISLCAILFFAYTNYNLEPLFYQTDWHVHRWICYFYVSNLLTFLLYKLYQWMKKNEVVQKVFAKIGVASYEIYLVQMALFYIVPKSIFSFVECELVVNVVWIFSTLLICLSGGLFLYHLIDRYGVKTKNKLTY